MLICSFCARLDQCIYLNITGLSLQLWRIVEDISTTCWTKQGTPAGFAQEDQTQQISVKKTFLTWSEPEPSVAPRAFTYPDRELVEDRTIALIWSEGSGSPMKPRSRA